MTMWKLFASIIGLVALLGLVSGCSCEETPPPPTAPATATTAAATSLAPQAKAMATPTPRFIFVFIDADIEVGPAPLRVEFGTYDPYQSMMRPTYRWDFGDGSPVSTLRSPVHVFEKPGDYEVKLFVEDDGVTDEDSVEIQVDEPEVE